MKKSRLRVTINTDPMPATPSRRRSPSSAGTRTPRSPRTPRGSKLPGESDSPRKIRGARNMARLRKITASPCEMRSPVGPQLSPRKVFVPHLAMSGLSVHRKNTKSNGSPRRAAVPAPAQLWSPPIASPGTRKYLEVSYATEAAKIDALDNGEQHLLRALLVENTATDPAQLYKACEYYEKSILIRDDDAKVAKRMYNYASFCLLRLGDATKAEMLLRNALRLSDGDPEISFGLAQCLYLREKPSLIRIQKAKKAGASAVEDISDDDDDDEDCTNFPASLQPVIDEVTTLFDEAVENFDEEVAVLLEAGEFFRDIGNIERAQELFEMAKELDMGDTMVDSDDDSDEEEQEQEQEDPMKFTLRRKKLSGPEVKFRCALFTRDSLGDIPAALEVLEELFGQNRKDLDIIVALADTLRIAWEKTDPSERNPAIEDETLQRAAKLCVRGNKIHDQKSDPYWSLGLILRCRGTPPPTENEEDNDDSGSGKKRGRKKGRRKKKKKNRHGKRREQALEETPAELRHKGLHMLLKAVQLESHVPVAEHLVYIAQILASEAEEQKQADMAATLAAAARAAVISSSKQSNQNKTSPLPSPRSLPNNNERLELAKSFFEQAFAISPSDPDIAQALADFLINQLNSDSDSDTTSQPFNAKAMQAMAHRAAYVLESAAACDMENLVLQNKAIDFLESQSMFRRADKIMHQVTQSILKKKHTAAADNAKNGDDDDDDNEEQEDHYVHEDDYDLNTAQKSIIKRYAEFLICRRFQFTRAHALLATLGADNIDDELKEKVLAIYDQVEAKRALTWQGIVSKQKGRVSDPPASSKVIDKKKGKKVESEEDVLPIDRVHGTILISRVQFLSDVMKENDAAIEFVEEQLLPYATLLEEEVVVAASAAAAADADGKEESSADSSPPANPIIKKFLEMMIQVARLYAIEDNHDAAFAHLSSAVTKAGFADVGMLKTPVAEGGFFEVGEAVGEKQWSPLLENVDANAVAEKAKARAAKLRKKK